MADVNTNHLLEPGSAPSPEIARAVYILRIAAEYIRNYCPDRTIHYDEADCDGSCLSDDCESEADMLSTSGPSSVEVSALTAAQAEIKRLEFVIERLKGTFDAYVSGAQRAGVVFSNTGKGIKAEYNPGLSDAIRECGT